MLVYNYLEHSAIIINEFFTKEETNMSNNKFWIELHIDGIGPHRDSSRIDFADEVESNKAIFFAPNGTGKTFISRAFRVEHF